MKLNKITIFGALLILLPSCSTEVKNVTQSASDSKVEKVTPSKPDSTTVKDNILHSTKNEVLHPTSNSVSDFEKQIADGIVIVDFFATWCGPCRGFAPTFEKASKNFTTIKFIKVDVDQYNEIAKKYNVRSMPTIMIFKNGTKVETKLGAMSYSEFSSWISNYL